MIHTLIQTGNCMGAPVLAPFSPCSGPMFMERVPVERPVYGNTFLKHTVHEESGGTHTDSKPEALLGECLHFTCPETPVDHDLFFV